MVGLWMLVAIVLRWIESESGVKRRRRLHLVVMMVHMVFVRMVEGDGRGVVGIMLVVVRVLRIIVRVVVGHRGETDTGGRDKVRVDQRRKKLALACMYM